MASPPNLSLKQNNFHKAQLAIEAGQHDHAAHFLFEISSSVSARSELSPSERKFLTTSLNSCIDDQLQALHILDQSADQSMPSTSYRKRIVCKIQELCRKIKFFIKYRLIPSSHSAESIVSYLTLKGDASRCIAELEEDEGVEEKEMLEAIEAFNKAKAIAKAELMRLNPVRLTMALHRAALYWDFLELQEKGFKIVNNALIEAIEAGGNPTEGESAKEITELMSKLSEYYTSLFETDEIRKLEQKVENP